jgi:cell division protein FtsB
MRNSKATGSFTTWRKVGVALIALACCCGAAVGLYHLYHPGFEKLKAIKTRIMETEARVEELKQENEVYEEKSRKLREPPAGDPLYIEKVAREKVGLVREGETVYHQQDSP